MTPKSAATYFTIGERLLEMVAVKLVRCHPEILFEANLEGQNLVMDDITYRLEGGGGGYLVEWWVYVGGDGIGMELVAMCCNWAMGG